MFIHVFNCFAEGLSINKLLAYLYISKWLVHTLLNMAWLCLKKIFNFFKILVFNIFHRTSIIFRTAWTFRHLHVYSPGNAHVHVHVYATCMHDDHDDQDEWTHQCQVGNLTTWSWWSTRVPYDTFSHRVNAWPICQHHILCGWRSDRTKEQKWRSGSSRASWSLSFYTH